MGRRSKTQFAVLGCLTIRPMSGYDMRGFIEETLGYFWQESYGQLYPTLKRLHEQGLVEKEVEQQAGSPDRHVYSITDLGREHLRGWLVEETEAPNVRHELLLKIFFAPEAGPDAAIRQLEEYVARQEALLEMFRGVAAQFEEQEDPYEHRPYWFATLRHGLHITEARLLWGRETIERIRQAQLGGSEER